MHTDQTGCIKGRGIFQNIRLIEDIIWYTDKEKIEAVLLSLDYSKAFDCISKFYIQNILAKFGFGPDFQNWFSVFNKDSKSCVLNCGWMTNWFPLGRGLRQGCPLSGLLFVLGIEILSCKIRQVIIKNHAGLYFEYNALKNALKYYISQSHTPSKGKVIVSSIQLYNLTVGDKTIPKSQTFWERNFQHCNFE